MYMSKVLVIGSGGRENALAWKISQSANLEALYCMPGNPGMESVATNIAGSASDFKAVEQAVRENGIDLVVVGPENPLVDGLADHLRKNVGVKVVGPGADGAQLEGSKDFAKQFMARYSVPTAAYRTFSAGEEAEAEAFLKTLTPPYVLKADGLAAGKGVLIDDDYDVACAHLKEMFGGKFGSAGVKVVIEQYLNGIELSVFVLTDGNGGYLILPEAKDYKRIGEGDTGLNTGGMGAVSPVPFATPDFMKKVEERIVKPTLSGLSAEGIDYRGFIFLGLMNCGGDPYVIEYNVRMGDPETEAVMTRIESDLLSHLNAAAAGDLSGEKISISGDTAVTVVMVSGGYPEKYKSNCPISGLGDAGNAVVFHSGTRRSAEGVVSAGGRVLAVTAKGSDIRSAKENAFETVRKISFEGCYFRRDISDDLAAFE